MPDSFEKLVGPKGAEGARLGVGAAVLPVSYDLKGTLVAVGGNMNNTYIQDDLQRVIDLEHNKENPDYYDPSRLYTRLHKEFGQKGIVIITSASEKHHITSGEKLRAIFKHLGGADYPVHVINTHDKTKVDTPENLDALKKASLVFMGGGDQLLLSDLFRGTQALETMTGRLKTEKDFTVSGSSAGAMVMAGDMMYAGRREKGFGWLPVMVDTHVDAYQVQKAPDGQVKEYGRVARLKGLVEMPDTHDTGIGLSERTAVMVSGGKIHIYVDDQMKGKHAEAGPSPMWLLRPGGMGKMVIDQIECHDGHCIAHFKSSADSPAVDVQAVKTPPVKPQPVGAGR